MFDDLISNRLHHPLPGRAIHQDVHQDRVLQDALRLQIPIVQGGTEVRAVPFYFRMW
jgi:hypothetical protein